MHKYYIALASCLFISMAASESLAKRYGCHTSISIQFKNTQTVPVAYMNSRRGCKAGDSDSTCRRKARNQAKVCAEALIHSTKTGIPKNCNSNMTGQVPYAWSRLGGQNALKAEAHYFYETLNGRKRYTKGEKVPFKVIVRTWWGGGTDGQTAWYDIDWDWTPSSKKAAAKACKGKWVFDGGTSKYSFLKLKPGVKKASGNYVSYGGANLRLLATEKPYNKNYTSTVNPKPSQLRVLAEVTPHKKIEQAIVALGKARNKKFKRKWKSEAFAPLDPKNKNNLMRAHSGKNDNRDYKGCGRHAAKNVLDFLGYESDISVVGKYIPFAKGPMAAELTKRAFVKAYKYLRKIATNGKSTKLDAKQKATYPDSIVQGVNRYLKDKKDKVRLVRKTMKRKDPAESIRTHIPEKGPVIALVANGAHYVTAMGYWEPLFSGKHRLTSFYTFDNAFTVWHPAGYFSLKFNKTTNGLVQEFARATGKHQKSWRPGTLMYLKSNN